MPMARRRSAVRPLSESLPKSTPSMATRPEVGGVRPPTTCSSVLLPLPEAPTMATKSPGATCSDTPRRAGTMIWPTGYSLVTFSASTIHDMSDDDYSVRARAAKQARAPHPTPARWRTSGMSVVAYSTLASSDLRESAYRDHAVDLIKGWACLLMVVAHVPFPDARWLSWTTMGSVLFFS